MKSIFRQIFTGPDNENVAWGRVMGAIVFVLFVIVLPIAVVLGIAWRMIEPHAATDLLHELTTYIPAMCLAAAALVAGTAFAEGKPKGPAE